jgi:hypothetical protein
MFPYLRWLVFTACLAFLHLQMMAMLDGDWKLVYTSNSELLAILALSKLPFVTIGDITQRVDTLTNTVENRAALSVPLSRTSLSTTASFEVRSPKRLQVRFERGSIATPELLSDLEVPESVDVLGQTVDLSQLRGVLQPFSQGLSSILKQVRTGPARDVFVNRLQGKCGFVGKPVHMMEWAEGHDIRRTWCLVSIYLSSNH